MSNTYTWEFPSLTTLTSHAGQNNVVTEVHWRLTASDGNNHTATSIGVQYITFVENTSFTPFDELTLDDIVSWTVNSLGNERIAEIKASLDSSILEQINPTKLYMTAPWLKTTIK
jgi:hypothetical protein